MGDYLKLFETHTEYQTYEQSGDMLKPNVSYCVQENEVHYNPYVHDYADDYLTFVALEDGTFQLSTNAVSYSLDNGETWTSLAANTASPTVTTGNKIMWKGELTPSSSYGIGTFSATGNFDVQGNIMSLLFGDNFKKQIDLTGKDYAFYNLFSGNTKVISAENLSLPATTLASHCYYCMFSGCTSLTIAPELHATTLVTSCYYSMFYGCTSLVTAPELPAKTLAGSCYTYMFYNTNIIPDCSNIDFTSETVVSSSALRGLFAGTKITDEDLERILPKNTNGKYCLPVTTLADGCYSNMFQDCTSLTTAPVLPATTLVSNCYRNMFSVCTNLNYIKAMFTTTPSTLYTRNWVSGVAATGTFVKNSAATWNVTGNNGIPNGWTVQTASE